CARDPGTHSWNNNRFDVW
nr:immunoglobulin heavy chain junction region [Macaca mulatta]MOW21596.1 immunoglobulin heavy chain junction region [Macaca mulatta]MOW22037.1 immunoglobulin heavy chain junction region [Macaca mulatta]